MQWKVGCSPHTTWWRQPRTPSCRHAYKFQSLSNSRVVEIGIGRATPRVDEIWAWDGGVPWNCVYLTALMAVEGAARSMTLEWPWQCFLPRKALVSPNELATGLKD